MKTTVKQSLLKKPIFWAMTALVVGGIWISSEPTGSTKSGIKPTTAKRTTTTAKGSVVFTEEDETASFNKVSQPMTNNAFFPAISRGSGLSGGSAANLIPADFADGDSNWVYTGSAEVNGVRSALLENKKTGEGAFLKTNQRWKSAVVISVGTESVVLTGPSGTRTLGLLREESANMSRTMARNPNQDFAPIEVNVPSNLRGRIGQLPDVQANGGLTVVPSGNNSAAAFAGEEGVVFDGN